MLLALSCHRTDPALAKFETRLAPVDEKVIGAVAATYLYRMSTNPEEQVMQHTLNLIRERRASAGDLQTAITAELAARDKYLGGLDEQIGAARVALTALSESAHAIRDQEIRGAAAKIVRHRDEELRLCSEISKAYRERSSATEDFLRLLLNKSGPFEGSRLANANAAVEKARHQLEAEIVEDESLVAEYRGTKERRTSSRW